VVKNLTHEYFVLKNSGEQKGQDRHGIAEDEPLQRPSDAEFREKRIKDWVKRQVQQEGKQRVYSLHLVGFDLPIDAVNLAVH